MNAITDILPAGAWTGDPADRVTLDYDGRHRRRIVLTGASGAEYLLDLAEATHLRDGDGLQLPGGGILAVVARPEPLLEVRARSAEALIRLAWHIGNRHLAAQVFADRILIRRDHVIAHMLEHQGAIVTEVEAAFDPEGGAYHDHGAEDHAH
ncbi:MAG: urease accessory protein UreE [Alphaproteobacteria bacterium]|nr:urease accessory protein UreE [Alphaproteobacteria bacterium]MBU1515240.1 urease accessory protein UreE [Alphaproteobacteria bacterium]MBU2092370.1 urease accessory protein UreE [Alphaproteobacteria bacterium]MBU2152964.1 urease accessory protein UreE [Alphaproteobacteria bacterium]MBU2305795.1 urease accessory protein UreE [Alphaproteobacteria bacterium]